MRSIKSLLIATAMLFIFVTVTSAQIANGGFDSGPATSGYVTVYAGDPSITGWTVTGGSVDYIVDYWTGSPGPSLDLSGLYQDGGVSQEIPTTPGSRYRIQFMMSGNPDGGPMLKTMTVATNNGNTKEYTYDTWENSTMRTDMKWESNSFYFTASATTTVISFSTAITTAFGPALDDVSISLVVAPPAIANEYINSNPLSKKAAPTVRGCVISKIAQKISSFELDGGGYDAAAVQLAVRDSWVACGGSLLTKPQ